MSNLIPITEFDWLLPLSKFLLFSLVLIQGQNERTIKYYICIINTFNDMEASKSFTNNVYCKMNHSRSPGFSYKAFGWKTLIFFVWKTQIKKKFWNIKKLLRTKQNWKWGENITNITWCVLYLYKTLVLLWFYNGSSKLLNGC
jgi:hypothetical protein